MWQAVILTNPYNNYYHNDNDNIMIMKLKIVNAYVTIGTLIY